MEKVSANSSVKETSDLIKKQKKLRIAFIGGLDRCECRYKEVAKSFGCELYYHNGRGRAEDLKSLVRRCDVVFCPTDINGHNACKIVKRFCKVFGKSCVFLRSSGISQFRRTLVEVLH